MDFNIPIVLFSFRRNKYDLIIDRIRQVKPKKIYIISDYGRNEKEIKEVIECRKSLEKLIDWDCTIIKNYAEENRGVYKNIGEGAKWVFQQEEQAIFLEDDNLPEVSFFNYCKELLCKYKEEEKILWICGTNYLGHYDNPEKCDYMFTQHLLPCGWASWRDKFLKYYDGSLSLCSSPENVEKAFKNYYSKQLALQYRFNWMAEYRRIINNTSPRSWDYQMDFSIKYYDLYGISPVNNQIKNIGVDDISAHGGTTMENTMTKRFCSMPSYPLSFPLRHPSSIKINNDYERKIAKILLYPFNIRMKLFLSILIRKVFNISEEKPLKEVFHKHD